MRLDRLQLHCNKPTVWGFNLCPALYWNEIVSPSSFFKGLLSNRLLLIKLYCRFKVGNRGKKGHQGRQSAKEVPIFCKTRINKISRSEKSQFSIVSFSSARSAAGRGTCIWGFPKGQESQEEFKTHPKKCRMKSVSLSRIKEYLEQS
jgi:hypothetical protein